MITEGKLTKVNESPVLVEMREVLALRDQREADPRYRKQPPPDQVTQLLENFQKIIASVEEMSQRALTMQNEIQARNEENYQSQINQLKAELEAERARRWFKKDSAILYRHAEELAIAPKSNRGSMFPL